MSYKIVHTITKLELGGAQQNTLFTLGNLDRRCQGFLVAGKGGILDSRALSQNKYIVRFDPFLRREINPLADFLSFFWMFFYFLGLRPDIVHSHSSKAGILSRWAARLAGVPVIIHTFHGFGFTPLQKRIVRSLFIWTERITAKVSTKLITVAYANIEKALENKIGRRKQYIVVRSGIDISRFEKKKKFANIKYEIGLDKEDKLVGNISCFKPQKGLFDFVEACALLSGKGDYKFILVGDGKLKGEILKKVAERGLEKRFFMLGWRRDIENILPDFDVMLHTAYFEGLPRVFLESMACGVPIVAAKVDGAVDVIEHGVNGFLVETGNIKAMAEYTEKLMRDESLRERMGKKGREKLEREFDINEMSKKLNRLYTAMMKGI